MTATTKIVTFVCLLASYAMAESEKASAAEPKPEVRTEPQATAPELASMKGKAAGRDDDSQTPVVVPEAGYAFNGPFAMPWYGYGMGVDVPNGAFGSNVRAQAAMKDGPASLVPPLSYDAYGASSYAYAGPYYGYPAWPGSFGPYSSYPYYGYAGYPMYPFGYGAFPYQAGTIGFGTPFEYQHFPAYPNQAQQSGWTPA